VSDADERSGPTTGDPQQDAMQRWEQRRAGGRASFIWRYGVLGWGLPAALLTIAYAVIQEQGMRISGPFSTRLRVAIAVAAVFFPTLGHLFGRRLWTSGEERYERLARDVKKAAP
jgi:hypothetical protein